MVLYEHIYLARQDTSVASVEKLTQQFKDVIEDNGGKVKKVEYWGLRPLAYKIKNNRRAHYTLMNIDAPPSALQEMERQMRIHEDVIRHLSIKVKEHEETPSVMMQNKEREMRPKPYHAQEPHEENDRREKRMAERTGETGENEENGGDVVSGGSGEDERSGGGSKNDENEEKSEN